MAHVVVVGVGNIGSHLVPHVGRMCGVTAVTIVDPDVYTQSNLAAQNIYTPDVGKSKAQVQARRLRQIDRGLKTRAFQTPVEDLPLGCLRADVILAAVDSRRARMVVNHVARRLNLPWIDAGVEADGLLARVQVFVPAVDAPCLECAWSPRDYELVEQTYACQPATGERPTGASPALGALAAAVQALECEKLLAGDHEHLLVERDLMMDARHHRNLVTTFRRSEGCRMPDHVPWQIQPYDVDPASTTLGDFLAMAGTLRGADDGLEIAVAGQAIATHVTCAACGGRAAAGYVHRGALRDRGARCAACGGSAAPTGFDLEDRVGSDAWVPPACSRSLSELGVLVGDVVTLATPSVEVHLQIGGDPWPIAS